MRGPFFVRNRLCRKILTSFDESSNQDFRRQPVAAEGNFLHFEMSKIFNETHPVDFNDLLID